MGLPARLEMVAEVLGRGRAHDESCVGVAGGALASHCSRMSKQMRALKKSLGDVRAMNVCWCRRVVCNHRKYCFERHIYVSHHTAPRLGGVSCRLLPQVRTEAETETAKLTPGFKQIAAKLEAFIEENAGEQKVWLWRVRDLFRSSPNIRRVDIPKGMRN